MIKSNHGLIGNQKGDTLNHVQSDWRIVQKDPERAEDLQMENQNEVLNQ